jgi:hypothetical protein
MDNDENNTPFNLIDIAKKIGVCLLILFIVAFYALCYHQLTN